MKTKHTQGPWKKIKTGKSFEIIADAPILPAEANARLIAAAPEMLEALKLALGLIENMEGKIQKLDYVTVTGEIERSIAKAEGREE